MRILWTCLQPHWRLGLLALLFAATSQILALVDPIIFGTIIDSVSGPKRLPDAELMYNGVPTTDLRFHRVRRRIGFVTQETYLFAGTCASRRC